MLNREDEPDEAVHGHITSLVSKLGILKSPLLVKYLEKIIIKLCWFFLQAVRRSHRRLGLAQKLMEQVAFSQLDTFCIFN